MELLGLKIRNIASIADAEIDFSASPLKDEPVFLICGDTGAGKSTILDAVCLALYNEAPRLSSVKSEWLADDAIPVGKRSDDDTVKTDDTRQFLRKGTGRGAVELLFSGNDEKEYRAVWSISRAYGKADGRLQKVEWTVECDGEILKNRNDVKAKIEAVTGMNFDQYCRTAMLAQGDFARFLKSSEDEKAVILEKLTRTDIYSRLGMMIARENREHADAFKAQQKKTGGIALMDDDERKKHSDDIARLEQESSACRIRKESADRQLRLLERLDKLSEELRLCQSEKMKFPGIFSRMSADLEMKKKEVLEKTAGLNALMKKLEDCHGYEAMFQAADTINSILQNVLDSRLAYARILKTSDEKKAAILTAEKRILAAGADKSAKEKTKAALQQDYARTAAMIEEAGKSGLLSSKDKLTDKKMHAMEALSAVMNMNEGKRRQDESEKELAGIVTELTNVRKAMAGKESACGNAEREFSRIREMYLKLKESTYDWAKETRSKLKAGDICPVCGHTVDTAFSDDRFESLLKPVEEKYLEAENVKKEAESALNQAVAEEKAVQRTLADARERTERASEESEILRRKALEKCASLMINPEETDTQTRLRKLIDETDREIRLLTERLDSVTVLEKKADGIHRELEKADRDLEKSRAETERLAKDLEAMKGDIIRSGSEMEASARAAEASLEQAGKLISKPGWRSEFEDDPEAFMSALKKETGEFTAMQRTVSDTEKDIERKNGLISNAETLRSRISDILSGTVPETTGQMVRIGWDSLVNEWNMLTVNIRTLETRMTDTREKIKTCSDELKASASEDGGYGCPELLQKQSAELEKAIAGFNQEIGAIRQRLVQDEENRRIYMKEKQKEEELKITAEKWEKLYKLFGDAEGKKFKKIAQSFILSDLIRNANTYLGHLSGRYVLDNQSGSLTITVRDMYQGGAERSVNTLSGGESFLVSLALALGLSSLSGNTMQTGTIFIDEGFGTLSAECLNTVMSALENLHQMGGKKVGIISHVEALRERIPVKIQLTRQGNSSSRVSIVTA